MPATTTMRVVPSSTLDAVIGGTFAGFAIQRASDDAVLLGAVRVPAFEGAGVSPIPFPFNPVYPPHPMPMTARRYAEVATLEAGERYRFTLLADGPSSLTLAAPGLAAPLVVQPSNPAPVSGAVFDLGPHPGAGAVPLGDAALPLSIGPGTLVVVASVVAHVAGQATLSTACVTEAAATASCGAGLVYATPLSIHTRMIDDRTYTQGSIAAAVPTAKFRTVSAGLSTFRRGFVLVWEAGAT